ncbi:hypothetical protein ASZ90_017557 [hydrocarbon metagenome]|uniref:Hydrogenase nickel incorporation protein hypa n=1 Tax=hydrocarbon metagenome TaxID=938273 RepID=A0A0W8E980_9ZZZZ
MQRYFDYASRGTIAEGATLEIERIPVLARCDNCHESFGVNWWTPDIYCTRCGGTRLSLLSGREFSIEEIEVF